MDKAAAAAAAITPGAQAADGPTNAAAAENGAAEVPATADAAAAPGTSTPSHSRAPPRLARCKSDFRLSLERSEAERAAAAAAAARALFEKGQRLHATARSEHAKCLEHLGLVPKKREVLENARRRARHKSWVEAQYEKKLQLLMNPELARRITHPVPEPFGGRQKMVPWCNLNQSTSSSSPSSASPSDFSAAVRRGDRRGLEWRPARAAPPVETKFTRAVNKQLSELRGERTPLGERIQTNAGYQNLSRVQQRRLTELLAASVPHSKPRSYAECVADDRRVEEAMGGGNFPGVDAVLRARALQRGPDYGVM
jgi:hypothetical protein